MAGREVERPPSAATRDSPTEGPGGAPASHRPEVVVPPGTTELGIDIVKVDRIRATMARFGDRFSRRVLTERERRYVRDRAETFAGRWAAKEAVSKVLGLGVRGIGWTEIEIERLPTGQPSVRLHGRAAGRAEQLGMGRIAVSISHEAEYAVAVAFGIRTAGGRYVFPLDIDERLDDRERRILARFERMRELHEATQAMGAEVEAVGGAPVESAAAGGGAGEAGAGDSGAGPRGDGRADG